MRVYQGANVTVTGITIRSSPKFHLTFDTCHAVEVHDVTIASPGDSPNTDGIHLAGSVGVSIHHTTIACGNNRAKTEENQTINSLPRAEQTNRKVDLLHTSLRIAMCR